VPNASSSPGLGLKALPSVLDELTSVLDAPLMMLRAPPSILVAQPSALVSQPSALVSQPLALGLRPSALDSPQRVLKAPHSSMLTTAGAGDVTLGVTAPATKLTVATATDASGSDVAAIDVGVTTNPPNQPPQFGDVLLPPPIGFQ
jgi:hypothetical protein